MLPPSQSLTSTVLNGMGNGMTVGGIPLIVAETSAFFTKRNLKPREMMIYSSLLAAGAVIGAVFGVAEAKQITNYRNSLNDEINRLHDKEATNDQKIDALMKKGKVHDFLLRGITLNLAKVKPPKENFIVLEESQLKLQR